MAGSAGSPEDIEALLDFIAQRTEETASLRRVRFEPEPVHRDPMGASSHEGHSAHH